MQLSAFSIGWGLDKISTDLNFGPFAEEFECLRERLLFAPIYASVWVRCGAGKPSGSVLRSLKALVRCRRRSE